MHLWRATFNVGDFGVKQITLVTEDREESPTGGFGYVEREARDKAYQETSGWPSPIELVAIEYLDEIDATPREPEPMTDPKRSAARTKK